MHSTYAPRRSASLPALDFGLRVRIETNVQQRTIFHGAENLTLQELTSELALMVSRLWVRSFSLRSQLEQVTSALQTNVQCGFMPLAERAALDLAGLLSYARERRLADPELCLRGAHCGARIAELCSQEVR